MKWNSIKGYNSLLTYIQYYVFFYLNYRFLQFTCWFCYLQLFPYHLAEYVCRVMRVSPFRYYCDMIFEVMKNGNSLTSFNKSFVNCCYFTIFTVIWRSFSGKVGVGRIMYNFVSGVQFVAWLCFLSFCILLMQSQFKLLKI